jgi:transcriptional regulator with GAF, ATPase, and Fis domain
MTRHTSAPHSATAEAEASERGPALDPRDAAAFFARVSRELMEETAEVPTLQRIAERAVQVVPSSDHCGILLRRRRHRVESVASTSTLAEKCDALQVELDEGPCIDAVWDSEAYLTEDTSTETRWPRWAPRVAEHGIGSVLSLRLSTTTDTLGSLNLYAERKEAFSRDDVDLAVIYGLHAANAMSTALLVEGLQTAVQSRHMIGVAQGILMHNYGIGMEQAFEVLRRYSSHTNVKLREVARHVVESGDLPDGNRIAD